MSTKKTFNVEVLRCPTHGIMAVAINGERVTPSKCCGTWATVKSWKVWRHVPSPSRSRKGKR